MKLVYSTRTKGNFVCCEMEVSANYKLHVQVSMKYVAKLSGGELDPSFPTYDLMTGSIVTMTTREAELERRIAHCSADQFSVNV
jgi:hypothetical protein